MRTVHEVDKVGVDELVVAPAEEVSDGVAAIPDLARLREDEDDGVVEIGHEKVGPPFALGEFEGRDFLCGACRLCLFWSWSGAGHGGACRARVWVQGAGLTAP